MKVVFTLTPFQITAFLLLIEGEEDDGPWYNANQTVTLVGRTLTITGERCALWSDQNSSVMRLAHDLRLVPVAYSTSDTKLEWYDTMDGYITRTGDVAEAVRQWQVGHQAGWTVLEREGATALATPFGTPAYRKAAAQGTLPHPAAYAWVAKSALGA